MKVLLDQDVFIRTAEFLKAAGHDVLTAAEAELHDATDLELYTYAQRQGRVLITRDYDFGCYLFRDIFQGKFILSNRYPTLDDLDERIARELSENEDDEGLRTGIYVI